MTKLEKLANDIMLECEKDGEPITFDEALEMAKMELGAKEIKHYEQAEKPKKKAERKPKIDQDKINLIDMIYRDFNCDEVENLTVKNKQREITFSYNGFDYSIVLTKHRKK